MLYASVPPPTPDPYEHTLTTILGIVITRRKIAQDAASKLTCKDPISADCAEMLMATGKIDAFDQVVTLLSAALAETRGKR